MVENPMVIGNKQDSIKKDHEGDCAGCDKEILHGESYWKFQGTLIHAESDCIIQYVERNSNYDIAGE